MRKYSFLFLLAIISFRCSKDSGGSGGGGGTPPGVPLVTTNSTVTIFNVTSASATGEVVTNGGASITARGICYATHSTPTLADNVINSGLGAGTGSFGASMHNLTVGASYFVRAFATNSAGTGYGTAVMFTVTTPGPTATDVYAAGDLFQTGYNAATLWTNGIPAPLTTNINPGHGYSVFVSAGGDKYVSGYEKNGSIDMARVWKNGAGTFLTNSSNSGGIGWSVFATASDVYVSGECTDAGVVKATLWKNAVPSYLSSGPGFAYSVCVSGAGDVFVAGNDGNVAKIWKNGSTLHASNGSSAATNYWVTYFFPDVYAAGSEMVGATLAATIWKNGTRTFLTNGNFNARAYSVYVAPNGTDIYVAGYENNGTKNVAKLWKNGVPTSLTDGTQNGFATSVHGIGNDVYVGGYENDGTKNIPKLWKNGLEVLLQGSGGGGHVAGVFVR
ncbi:MAG TPA: hypothetical protein PLZ45_13445 [Ferruginibacter sp.]|nr:hypothetical protein [Ferruginibacter sp.]